ncbi:hypothetical protein N8D56_21235 [Devosia sp. A8/3-2]|nr:hypothetical protein N8D56_21235 [Devosia sp. A8/3-2]
MQQANAYNTQAAFADRQAGMELERGNYEATRAREQNDRKLAGMRGAYLSSGVALEGSPTEVIADSATRASLDEQAIRYGARVQAGNMQFEARQARANAGSAVIGSVIGALGTGLSGYSQYQNQQQKMTMLRNPYLTYGV